MADSIAVQWSMAVSASPFNDAISRNFTTAPAARGKFSELYTLAADHTESVMTISGLTANGLAVIENVGTAVTHADEILIGPEAAGAMVACLRIKIGEAFLLRIPTTGITLRAETGASETAIGKLRLTVVDN